MSRSKREKVVSIQSATADMVRERFTARYKCYATNTDVLRALAAHQLPPQTDLAVRVHLWNCQRCRSEYQTFRIGEGERLLGKTEELFRKDSGTYETIERKPSILAGKGSQRAGSRTDRENSTNLRKFKSRFRAS